MMMKIQIKTLLCTAPLLLGACATTQPALDRHTPTFGQAVANNISAQAIPPTPEQKANTFIPADRTRQAKARDRYRKDEVKKPRSLRTTR